MKPEYQARDSSAAAGYGQVVTVWPDSPAAKPASHAARS